MAAPAATTRVLPRAAAVVRAPGRARLFLACAAAAAVARAGRPSPAPRTVEGLAALLGAASGTHVVPADVAWEPSPGPIVETFVGRRALFLGSERPGAARDVYRALVRVTWEGIPVSVHRVRNLTATPLGDEMALCADGETAAFATRAYGRVDGVTVLELDPSARADAEGAAFAPLMDAVTAWQEVGSVRPVDRVEVSLDRPAARAALTLDGGALEVRLDEGRVLAVDVARRAIVGPARGATGPGPGGEAGAKVAPVPRLRKPPILWAVDTVRAEVGPEPVAWLENQVFGLREAVHDVGRSIAADDAPRAVVADAPPPVVDATGIAGDRGEWPPRPIASIWKNPDPAEGVWQPVRLPWLKKLPVPPGAPDPPPYFQQTWLRPDPQRAWAKILVVAMDMRQLEMDMEAGVEDPRPLTGPPGAGKIPRDPRILGRVVGAFNGAFKTTHGAYGMMVRRRVLLPALPGAASIVVGADHRVGIGTWGPSADIAPDVVSFRQNLEPIVEDGRLFPSGRTQWGFQLPGTSVMTERSGVCADPAGRLYYVWGDEVNAVTLGRGMIQVGCTYGIHLDMNPHHTGFVFAGVRIPPGAGPGHVATRRDYETLLLTPQMEIQSVRYLEYAPKDFFYLMVRDPAAEIGGEAAWVPDPGAQPDPAWLPAIWRSLVAASSAPTAEPGAAAQVEVYAFEEGRMDWRIRPGAREGVPDPDPDEAPAQAGRTRARADAAAAGVASAPADLSAEDAHRVIAAIGLGNSTASRRAGLIVAGQTLEPLRDAAALLVVQPGRAPRVALPSEAEGAIDRADATQLPLLAEGGELQPAARRRGSMHRRGAACTRPSGAFLVAISTQGSDEATATALVRAGCARVVALERGSRHFAFVHRAGTASPPAGRYDQTALYAVARPMPPRAYRLNPPVGR